MMGTPKRVPYTEATCTSPPVPPMGTPKRVPYTEPTCISPPVPPIGKHRLANENSYVSHKGLQKSTKHSTVVFMDHNKRGKQDFPGAAYSDPHEFMPQGGEETKTASKNKVNRNDKVSRHVDSRSSVYKQDCDIHSDKPSNVWITNCSDDEKALRTGEMKR